MNESVVAVWFDGGQVFGQEYPERVETGSFLRELGLVPRGHTKTDLSEIRFLVEFREYPSIFRSTAQEHPTLGHSVENLHISHIGPYGITFHTKGHEGNVHVFVPMHNISCIHSLLPE